MTKGGVFGPEGAAHGLIILARLAKRRDANRCWLERALDGRLQHLAESALDASSTTGGPATEVLAEAIARADRPAFEVKLLRHIFSSPYRDSLAGKSLSLDALQRMVERRFQTVPASPSGRGLYAAVMDAIGNRLNELKRPEEAVAAFRSALAAMDPVLLDRDPDLKVRRGVTLQNLALAMAELGDRAGALDALNTAVREMTQDLDADPRPATRRELAMALSNLSTVQLELGHLEDALASSRRAVALRRQAPGDAVSALDRQEMVAALNNHALTLRALWLTDEAVEAASEAAVDARELVHAYGETHLPLLARCLDNLATQLARSEEPEAPRRAADASTEAVAILEQLDAERPGLFTAELGTALHNLADLQRRQAQIDGAMASSVRAVEIFQQLAESEPARFEGTLAAALELRGRIFSRLERLDQALDDTRRALRLFRKQSREHPELGIVRLSQCLHRLGVLLQSAGDAEGAFTNIEEALRLLVPVAEERPADVGFKVSLFKISYLLAAQAAGLEPDGELTSSDRESSSHPSTDAGVSNPSAAPAPSTRSLARSLTKKSSA